MAGKSPDPVDVHVGGRVRMRRIIVGMSQSALARALGITFQQVQKYEKGTNRIGSSRMQQIVEALGAPISFFFNGAPGQTQASADQSTSPPPVLNFLATREGVAINDAFTRIKDARVRRKVIELVKAIAADAEEDQPWRADEGRGGA